MYLYNYVLTAEEISGITSGLSIPNDYVLNYRDVENYELVDAQLAQFPLAADITDGEEDTIYYISRPELRLIIISYEVLLGIINSPFFVNLSHCRFRALLCRAIHHHRRLY